VLLPAPVELSCSACAARHVEHDRQLLRCPSCGGFLEIATPARWPHARAAATETPPRWIDPARRGVWRYRPLLPLRDDAQVVSLGEGATPIVPLPRWGEAVGAPRAAAKLEHLAPTGSFKDRGMTLVVSRARELGARALVEDSSGNAGASTAAYAARAGIPATVYVPASAPAGKVRQIAAAGATVVPVSGPREAVTEAAVQAGQDGQAYYVGHNLNPFFSFGMTTWGYELIEAAGAELPDHVVMPAGGGSLYVGAWQGLRLWLGPDARLPRLHLVQPTGCQPIVAAQATGLERAAPVERRPTIAGGAEIEHPARDRQMLAALRDTGGLAVAVSDEALVAERRRLARLEGVDLEPTAALALAGVAELVRRGVVRPDESVLIATTGAGLKVPDEGA
jgi:threonine synthase